MVSARLLLPVIYQNFRLGSEILAKMVEKSHWLHKRRQQDSKVLPRSVRKLAIRGVPRGFDVSNFPASSFLYIRAAPFTPKVYTRSAAGLFS